MTDKRPAVIWDIDGTLIDSAELHYRAWHDVGKEYGIQLTREVFASTFGLRNPDVIPIIFGKSFDIHLGMEIAARKELAYQTLAEKELTFLPGAKEFIRELADQKIPQGLGSSAPKGNVDLFLRVTESLPFFSAIVTMEDVSKGKPEPDVFLQAASKLGRRPDECLVFEDAPAGVIGAKRAGMMCIGTTACGYHSDKQLRDAGADLVVKHLNECKLSDIIRLIERR